MSECSVEIRQILPAQGWRAVYAATLTSDPTDRPLFTSPLMGWALIEHMGCCKTTPTFAANCREEIVGLETSDIGVTNVEDSGNWIGYLAPGEQPYPWMVVEAEEQLQKAAEREARRPDGA